MVPLFTERSLQLPFGRGRSLAAVAAFAAALTALTLACSPGAAEDPALTPEPRGPRSEVMTQTATVGPGPTVASQLHLLLPDLETVPPDELYVEYGADGARLLRFSTTVRNVGRGPLELIGSYDEYGVAHASQLIQRVDGEVEVRDAGRLSVSESHGHWHFDNFALFELWPASPSSDTSGPAATQNKITFCLLDEVPIDPPPPYVAEAPRFITCDWQHQGISEGWMETYVAALPEQWVDITGLADGRYALRMTLDPDNLLHESNLRNNAVLILIELEGDTVTVVDDLDNGDARPARRLPWR